MQSVVYTVKEFNELVNTVLSDAVGEVTVTGEVSGYQVRQGKWVSFDLKDKDSVLNCFTAIYQLDMPLADGQEVVVTGTPRLYVPYGKFSFNVRSVQLKGEGALKKAYEELKAKLEQEGLFDPRHKQPLPKFPETIGVITSADGAAINDIRKVINGRWGGLTIYLAPVLVQGKNAPDELVGAINYFNTYHPVDVIIFGRGGGSLEDLQAFNSERVARAIFSSRIPIIAGIGHEHNTSIADLVADIRAATPSNAAEIAVPDRKTVQHQLNLLTTHAQQMVERAITTHRQHLNRYTQTLRLFLTGKVGEIRQRIHRIQIYAEQYVRHIQQSRTSLTQATERLLTTVQIQCQQSRQRVVSIQQLLTAFNPDNVVKRGYSITYNATTNKPITTIADMPYGGTIRTQVSDGSINATVAPLTSQNQTSLF